MKEPVMSKHPTERMESGGSEVSEPLSVIREALERLDTEWRTHLLKRNISWSEGTQVAFDRIYPALTALSELERRMEGLEKALERIKDRAQRITDSRLECTVFSAASYDLEVATKALSQRTDVVTQKEERTMTYPEPTEEREYIKVLSDHTTLVVDLVTRHLGAAKPNGEPYIERFGFLMAEFRSNADADAFIKANRNEQMS